MNCERFQTVASDLAHDQLMDANEQAAALQHVAECRDCGASLEEQRGLTAGLRALAGSMKEVSAPAELEAKMLAAFRERQNNKVVAPVFVKNHRRSWYWAAAVAAMLLFAFGIFIVRANLFKRAEPFNAKNPAPVNNSVAVDPKEQPKDESLTVKANDTVSPGPKKNPRRPELTVRKPKGVVGTLSNEAVASTTATQNARPAEVMTDFYPIGYSNTPNLQEGGQLLRVELPRTAVARFGLPVNMDRANQRVKADVLVGSDGLAQAIRFVQ
jgi:hypothetical protein